MDYIPSCDAFDYNGPSKNCYLRAKSLGLTDSKIWFCHRYRKYKTLKHETLPEEVSENSESEHIKPK